MKLNHPLMYNNISSEDLKAVKRFLKKKKYYFYSIKEN